MSILSKMIGEAAVKPIEVIAKGIDEIFTSDDERLNHKEVMAKIQQLPAAAQNQINEMQANHRTIFVAGARPFLMWVCGVGLANAFIVNPWIEWIAGSPAPDLPIEMMIDLVIAMLGLSGLRTYEKLRGLAR